MSQELKPAPGYYKGKIVAYGMKKTSAGLPAPTIAFTVSPDNEEASYKVFWQGSLKEGRAQEITLDALITCGLRDIRAFKAGKFANGLESNLLDTSKEYQLTIIHETAQNDPTKKYVRVQWINGEGASGGFKDAILDKEAGVLMQGMQLEATFHQIAAKNGINLSAPSSALKPPVEIPF